METTIKLLSSSFKNMGRAGALELLCALADYVIIPDPMDLEEFMKSDYVIE
jgi:hypothetical protein